MSKAKNYFLFNWEKFFLTLVLLLLFFLLHNIIYAKFLLKEFVFFTLTLIIAIYFIISSVYTLFYLTKKRDNIAFLIWSFIIVALVAFLGSIFTSSNVNSDWYSSIKPSITPPNFLFPIIWNILFFLIAISLYLSWVYSTKNEKRKVILAYGINFFLNILWSFLFFGLKQIILAFIEIILLFLSVLILIFVSYKIKRKSSYLLIPYLLWILFASILNYLSVFR